MRIVFGFLLLLPTIICWAQREIGEITNAYNEYHLRYEQVRVHLEFNQPKYAPGDTAYFKAYFLSYQFQPIKGRNFITVQLRNSNNSIIHLQNIKVDDGKAANQIVLSPQLSPGTYTIEAYNDWMKNFDEKFYFRKKIIVAGRRKVSEPEAQMPAPQIYAEGGQIIAGVTNQLVITSQRPGRGVIYTEAGEETAEFFIDQNGMAKISFTPELNTRYRLRMVGSSASHTALEAREDGLSVLAVSLGECSPLQLHISAPSQSQFRSRELYLITTAYGQVNYSKVFSLSDGETTPVLIPYRSLQDGLNQIFIMDTTGEVLAERIYFLSPMYSQVTLKANPNELFHPRDSVDIQVSLSDFFGNPVKGEFSISVINQKLFLQAGQTSSLRNSLYIFNDLPGLVGSYEKGSVSEDIWMKQINDWLITQKWERSNWKDILDEQERAGILTPFKKSLSFRGKVLSTNTGIPLQDSSAVSFFQSNNKIVYSTYSNSRGEFELPLLNDFMNEDRFYYKVQPVNSKTKLDDYIIVSDAISDAVSPSDVTFEENIDAYGEYVHQKRIIDHSYRTYLRRVPSVTTQIEQDPNLTFLNALSGEDIDITMGDFVVFPTVEDLIHEVVGGLQVRKAGGVPTIRVPIASGGYTRIPTGDPLYIVNGIFTLDTQKFLELSAEEMVYLKIVNDQSKLSKFGSFGTHGVVIVLTRQNQINETFLNTKYFVLAGVNQTLPFKARNNDPALRIPQLNASLHWNPTVSNTFKGLARVKIRLPDDLGPMRVSVSGVTFDGNPFSGSVIFEVVRPEYDPLN